MAKKKEVPEVLSIETEVNASPNPGSQRRRKKKRLCAWKGPKVIEEGKALPFLTSSVDSLGRILRRITQVIVVL